MYKDRPLTRFFTKIAERTEGGCWVWGAARDKDGYGTFSLPKTGAPVRAHRWSYEHFVGPIPEGLQIHHRCENKSCVSPHHLEPMTNYENLMASDTPHRRRVLQTACKRGHSLTDPANVYLFQRGSRPERHCRTCARHATRNRHGYETVRVLP